MKNTKTNRVYTYKTWYMSQKIKVLANVFEVAEEKSLAANSISAITESTDE